jgi:hypothetical protein
VTGAALAAGPAPVRHLAAALVVLAWLGGTATSLAADADSPLERLALSGSLRAGYWSSSRSLDDRADLGTAALWMRARPRLAPDASLFLEGWVRNEDLFDADRTSGILREGYLDVSIGQVDLRLGRQIIAWGRADRLNPTDNLTPRDFTLLVARDEDQRRGVAAARAVAHLGPVSVTAVWLPEFLPDVVPLRPPPRGVTVRERLPGSALGQWAARLEQTGRGIDWSVSYFDGFDVRPDLGLDRVGPTGVEVLLRHQHVRIVGADVATVAGRYALRAEAAYTQTSDGSGTNPRVKNPFVWLVAGAERSVAGDVGVGVQYSLRVVIDHRSPTSIADPVERAVAIEAATIDHQLDAVEHAVTVRVHRAWLNETLETELAALVSLTRLDYALRPRVTYAITDRLRATVGADVFRGPSRSFFGYLRDNSTAFVEVQWSF